jgi:hypothetical protein
VLGNEQVGRNYQNGCDAKGSYRTPDPSNPASMNRFSLCFSEMSHVRLEAWRAARQMDAEGCNFHFRPGVGYLHRRGEMSFEPQTAAEHFALKRTTDAAEAVKAGEEARYKGGEINRAANERVYNSLALFSSGTVALSITYLGYLKTLSKPVHPRWLMASWVSLMTCAACSLFWTFVYGRYAHYFLERERAESLKEKHEIEAKEINTLSRSIANLQTRAQLDAFRNPRLEAAAACEKNAKDSERREKFYMHMWRWLGRIAHVGLLLGLVLLLAFAIKNT